MLCTFCLTIFPKNKLNLSINCQYIKQFRSRLKYCKNKKTGKCTIPNYLVENNGFITCLF